LEEVLEGRPPASPVCRIEASLGYLPIATVDRGNASVPRREIRNTVGGERQVGQEAAKVGMDGGDITERRTEAVEEAR
jgi:hypothetical protein